MPDPREPITLTPEMLAAWDDKSVTFCDLLRPIEGVADSFVFDTAPCTPDGRTAE